MSSEPDPRTRLDDAAAARSALVATTERGPLLHVGISLLLGLALAASVYAWERGPGWWLLAGVAFVSSGALAVYDHRSARRRGRVLDERATASSFGRFFAVYLPLVVVQAVRPEPPVSLGWAAIAGCTVAVFGFVLMRWDQAYQSRRLRDGDYGTYDLV